MSALNRQIDGSHYTDKGLQPLELTYAVMGSPCFCKLAKYLSRDKGDRLVNLQKAKHCIELERDLTRGVPTYKSVDMPWPSFAILARKLVGEEQGAVVALHDMLSRCYESAIDQVEDLIVEHKISLKKKELQETNG